MYRDIDQDGMDELLIVGYVYEGDEAVLYDIYDEQNGKVREVFQAANHRDSGWITTDNCVCSTATGGAGYHVIQVFRFKEGEKEILEDMTVDTQVNPEDVDKYNQLVDEYTEKKLPLTFTPFSEVQ